MVLDGAFWKNSIITILGGVGVIGGVILDVKQDVAILENKTQSLEVQTSKDMERIESGLDKIHAKIDLMYEKMQGPAYRQPPRQ